MSEEWDGRERRDLSGLRYSPQQELAPILDEQVRQREDIAAIKQKMAQWEMGACLFRWFVMTAVGTVAMAAAAWEWLREHIK